MGRVSAGRAWKGPRHRSRMVDAIRVGACWLWLSSPIPICVAGNASLLCRSLRIGGSLCCQRSEVTMQRLASQRKASAPLPHLCGVVIAARRGRRKEHVGELFAVGGLVARARGEAQLLQPAGEGVCVCMCMCVCVCVFMCVCAHVIARVRTRSRVRAHVRATAHAYTSARKQCRHCKPVTGGWAGLSQHPPSSQPASQPASRQHIRAVVPTAGCVPAGRGQFWPTHERVLRCVTLPLHGQPASLFAAKIRLVPSTSN